MLLRLRAATAAASSNTAEVAIAASTSRVAASHTELLQMRILMYDYTSSRYNNVLLLLLLLQACATATCAFADVHAHRSKQSPWQLAISANIMMIKAVNNDSHALTCLASATQDTQGSCQPCSATVALPCKQRPLSCVHWQGSTRRNHNAH